MAVVTTSKNRLVLHYGDPNKGTYGFDRLRLNATDKQMYDLAHILNDAQADPMTKVSLTVTKLVVAS